MTLRVASEAFLEGYRLGRRYEHRFDANGLLADLFGLDPFQRPFAFEGAAMACRLRDEVDGRDRGTALAAPSGSEWQPFLKLGVGCALARLGREPPSDPLTLDGYGFQLGLLEGVSGPRDARLPDRSERGRGRALWFMTGGDGRACAGAIDRVGHQAEFWRGVGTACAFAGDPRGYAARLPELARDFADDVRLGAREGLELWRTLGRAVPELACLAAQGVGFDKGAEGGT